MQDPIPVEIVAALLIRPPRPAEAEAICTLFEAEVRAGRMLPRTPAEIRERLADWLVVAQRGQVVGCVSLVFYTTELCELRSLFVGESLQGQGVGGRLIRGAIDLARRRGARRVLTLTRRASLFERHGFRRDFVMNYPQKVWKDCAPCPLRERCDEIALVYYLDEEPLP